MKNIKLMFLFLPFFLVSSALSAEIEEIIVNADAELMGIILKFGSYEIEINAYGKIRSIDLIYDSLNINDYTFWHGKVQYKGREEFRIERRPSQNTFAKVTLDEKHNLFVSGEEGSNVDEPDYLGIEHYDRSRIDYHFQYKSKLRRLDSLTFKYEHAYKRLKKIGDVEFVYKDEEQKHNIANTLQLVKAGYYHFNTYRDFKVSQDHIKKTDEYFTIRVVDIY